MTPIRRRPQPHRPQIPFAAVGQPTANHTTRSARLHTTSSKTTLPFHDPEKSAGALLSFPLIHSMFFNPQGQPSSRPLPCWQTLTSACVKREQVCASHRGSSQQPGEESTGLRREAGMKWKPQPRDFALPLSLSLSRWLCALFALCPWRSEHWNLSTCCRLVFTPTSRRPYLLSLFLPRSIFHSYVVSFVRIGAGWHSICLRFRGGPRQCPRASSGGSTSFASTMWGITYCYGCHQARALFKVPGAGQRLYTRGQQRG